MDSSASFIHNGTEIYIQDALEGMANLPDKSFDLAIADPPYGASTNANWKLPKEHSLPGFGGAWKLASHAWDSSSGTDTFEFTLHWLTELKRLVRPTGSIWIHSTYHNSGWINVGCQLVGLEIINEVIWFKRNAFPNLSGRRLTASHETILWVHTGGTKRDYFFNYDEVKAASFAEDSLKKPGKQLRTVWNIPNNKRKEELQFGRHPTQKPLRLIQRILLISGKRGGRLLVPFLGSGTEVVAGLCYGMECIGFETNPEYFNLARQRITDEIRLQDARPRLELG